MREFCQSSDCDGLISFGSDSDGEIGACDKCGRQYELKIDYYIIPLDVIDDGSTYGTIAKLSVTSGEKIAEIRLDEPPKTD